MTSVAAHRRSRTEGYGAASHFDVFPRRAGRRWLLRFILAIPFLIAAVVSAITGATELDTPNQLLLDRIATVDWSSGGLEWIGEVYPPIAILLALVIPGGAVGLAIVGALVAGFALQKLIESLVQREIAVTLQVLLILALAANPLFFYAVTTSINVIVGLTFFGLAMANVERFVVRRQTDAGFRAGILFMLATLTHLAAILYVIAAVIAALFVVLGRAGQRGARGANVLVILYPTAAALFSLIVLNTIFLRDPLGEVDEQAAANANELGNLAAVFTSVYGWLLIATVLSAWAISFILRRPAAILISSLVFLAVLVAFVAGLIPAQGAGTPFLVLEVIAVTLMPRHSRRWQFVLLAIVVAIQIPIAWAMAATQAYLVEWMAALTSL